MITKRSPAPLSSPPATAAKPVDPPAIPNDKEFRELLTRAESGDNAVLPALRRLLDLPAAVDTLGGDLARETQDRLVRDFAGRNHLFAESIPRKLDMLRKDLAGPNPTPLERLLAERVVSCWLYVHQLEFRYAAADGMSISLATYYQRSIQRGQKNYLAAIRALATIRKLALPVLQVNIARKQVNVVNSTPADREGPVGEVFTPEAG